uniref:Uncharacterized protein n=1 Tax=Glossina palpalis gambiensis TaxID=67801 RepID=A0A1B0BA61_9MUSC
MAKEFLKVITEVNERQRKLRSRIIIYSVANEDIDRQFFIISCFLVLVVGLIIIFDNFKGREREREREFFPKDLPGKFANDNFEEGEEKDKKFLGTPYESLIRKHKIDAISLNQQITEVREEVAKWKVREGGCKYSKFFNKCNVILSILVWKWYRVGALGQIISDNTF